MVSQERRHLFVTPWGILSIIWSLDEGAESTSRTKMFPERPYLGLWRPLYKYTSKQEKLFSLVGSRDRVNVSVADPSIFLSNRGPRNRNPDLRGSKSGSRRPISCLNNGSIKKFCLQKLPEYMFQKSIASFHLMVFIFISCLYVTWFVSVSFAFFPE